MPGTCVSRLRTLRITNCGSALQFPIPREACHVVRWAAFSTSGLQEVQAKDNTSGSDRLTCSCARTTYERDRSA